MKNLFLALAIALSAAQGYAQTNVYHPFPDSAFWRVEYLVNTQMNGGCLAVYYFQHYTSGDTLINSITYRKVYKSYVGLTSSGPTAPCNPIPPFQFSGYVGALRDDSLSNQVRFIFHNHSTDSLLYDYNMTVGDTIKGIITNNCEAVVLSVDSILIYGKYRKRWNFDACGKPNHYIIEGIGSKSGLYEHINSGNPWYTLVCAKDEVGTLFTSSFNSSFGCNLVYNGIEELGFNASIEIFPNPSSGIFQVTSLGTISSTEIYDLLGNLVFNQHFCGKEPEIDLSGHPRGIYFLKGIDEEGSFGVKKIVLQ